jgi:UDP:flavonoid glycosyltransferase YjiC (YdhE family)
LLDAGHDVHAVTWPVHGAAFQEAGIPVVVAGPHDDPRAIAAVAADAASRGPMDQVAVLRDFHLADGAAHQRRLRDLLAGYDLVVLHAIHSLAHAAVLDIGARWATAVFDPVLLPTREAPPPGMPSMGPANRVGWWLLDRALARTGRPLDDVLAAAGSRQRGLPLFQVRSPLLHLVACSPSIMRVPRDLPSTTVVTGAWLDRSPAADLPDDLRRFLDGGDPPVVITFGSMGSVSGDAVASAVSRLASEGRRVVVQAPMPEGTADPRVLAIGAVDHRGLFPRASVVVHHGGAGTTHAACAAGVPSVVVPHVGDQRYWADRLHRLGAAPAPLLVDRVDGEALATAVDAAAGEAGFRAAAGRLSAAMALEDGTATAIARIEAAAGAA